MFIGVILKDSDYIPTVQHATTTISRSGRMRQTRGGDDDSDLDL
jgi:hypothetical protein